MSGQTPRQQAQHYPEVPPRGFAAAGGGHSGSTTSSNRSKPPPQQHVEFHYKPASASENTSPPPGPKPHSHRAITPVAAPSSFTSSSASSPTLLNKIGGQITGTLRRPSFLARRQLPCQKWTCYQVTEFLEACGLGMYSPLFEEQGVDGNILLELNPDQIERCMHMDNPLHMISLVTGVQLLVEGKIKNRVEDWEWTCAKTLDWLQAKGLESLVPQFHEMAVHGGVLFQLTQDEFERELGVDNALVLMSLMTSIERAREVGPVKFGDAIPDWSLSQIKIWLEQLSLGHLHGIFRTFGVNGSLLLHLDRDMMVHEMGLTEIQAMVLEKAIAKLQKQANSKSWFRRSSIAARRSSEALPPYAVPYH